MMPTSKRWRRRSFTTGQRFGRWRVFTLSAGTGTIPTATVCLRRQDGTKVQDAACGDGPVDAVFKTIERITGVTLKLRDYQVRSVSVGEDAQGEAHIEADHGGKMMRGRGVSTDIIEASANAFLQVVNRIILGEQRRSAVEEAMIAAS